MSVTVVGSANVDVVVRAGRIPAPGETILGHDLARGGGGKGANQAVAVARAGGIPCAFVGAVGTDPDGDFLIDLLNSAGVGTAAVARVSEPTGTALITVSDDAENAIVVVPGANANVTLTPEQRGVVGAAEVVLAQLEIPQEAVLAAALARKDGAIFVLNAAPSAPLLPELLAQIDVLIVNEHEACDLAGMSDPEAAANQLAQQVATVVLTLGGAGSIVLHHGNATPVPAMAVTPVDTTGAGDTFCGVLAARLAAGEDVVAAAVWGSAAAALAVQQPGAIAAIPTAAEVAAMRGL